MQTSLVAYDAIKQYNTSTIKGSSNVAWSICRLFLIEGRNMVAYEWRSDLKESKKFFTWIEFEASPFSKYSEALQKLGFKPTRVVHYRCMYKSDVPALKWVLHRETAKGYDKAVFYSCIHNGEMLLVFDGESFKSGPSFPGSVVMERQFRDFVLEKEPCLLRSNSMAVLKRYPNEAQLLYNPYQTKNPKLLAPQFRPQRQKKLQMTMLFLLVNKRKQKNAPTPTK